MLSSDESRRRLHRNDFGGKHRVEDHFGALGVVWWQRLCFGDVDMSDFLEFLDFDRQCWPLPARPADRCRGCRRTVAALDRSRRRRLLLNAEAGEGQSQGLPSVCESVVIPCGRTGFGAPVAVAAKIMVRGSVRRHADRRRRRARGRLFVRLLGRRWRTACLVASRCPTGVVTVQLTGSARS